MSAPEREAAGRESPGAALPGPVVVGVTGASGAVYAQRLVRWLLERDFEVHLTVSAAGRIVVADPDYDTQVVDVEDQGLARRVLRFRADHLLRNGTIAHRAGGLLAAEGLRDIVVEAAPVVLRDPTALDNAMGLRTWAAVAEERGVLPAGDGAAWERALDAAVAGNHFLYAFTVFITAGTVP